MDIDLAVQRRKRREEIARINGFDEVSDEQRKKNLALNMALKEWPQEEKSEDNFGLGFILKKAERDSEGILNIVDVDLKEISFIDKKR